MTLIYFRISKMTVKLETLIVLLSNIFLVKIQVTTTITGKISYLYACIWPCLRYIYCRLHITCVETEHDQTVVFVLFWHRHTGFIPSSVLWGLCVWYLAVHCCKSGFIPSSALWGLCSTVCLVHCSPLLQVFNSSVSVFCSRRF